MSSMVPSSFAAEVEAFLASSGMLPTTFGKAAMGDPAFVWKLRRGRKVGLETAIKVRAYIASAGRAEKRPAGRKKEVAA